MDQSPVREALGESASGAEFLPPALALLAAGARQIRCARGTVLFREGETRDAFYMLRQGHVALEMCLPARGCTRILTLGPGDIVAWSALLGSGPMTATAVAAEDVELIELSGAELRNRCDVDPSLGYVVMRWLAKALAQRLLATRLQLLDMFSGSAADSEDRS